LASKNHPGLPPPPARPAGGPLKGGDAFKPHPEKKTHALS